jgi:hypothetical protein
MDFLGKLSTWLQVQLDNLSFPYGESCPKHTSQQRRPEMVLAADIYRSQRGHGKVGYTLQSAFFSQIPSEVIYASLPPQEGGSEQGAEKYQEH